MSTLSFNISGEAEDVKAVILGLQHSFSFPKLSECACAESLHPQNPAEGCAEAPVKEAPAEETKKRRTRKTKAAETVESVESAEAKNDEIVSGPLTNTGKDMEASLESDLSDVLVSTPEENEESKPEVAFANTDSEDGEFAKFWKDYEGAKKNAGPISFASLKNAIQGYALFLKRGGYDDKKIKDMLLKGCEKFGGSKNGTKDLDPKRYPDVWAAFSSNLCPAKLLEA